MDEQTEQLQDLIALYKAIDAIIRVEPDGPARAIAQRYIPQYADPAVVGWTEHLDRFLAARPDRRRDDPRREAPRDASSDDPRPGSTAPTDEERPSEPEREVHPDRRAALALREARPSAEEAMVHIATKERWGRMQSRTLIPLAVLGRISGIGTSFFEPALIERAIRGMQLGEPDQDVDVIRLIEAGVVRPEWRAVDDLPDALLDDDLFPDLPSWPLFAHEAAEVKLMSATVAQQPAPCSGTLHNEPIPGTNDEDPVPRLATHFCSTTVTDAQVQAFLDPMGWKECSPLYCDMIDGGVMPDGRHKYIEIVSPSCPDDPMQVCLLVRRTEPKQKKDVYILTYDLCPDASEGNGKVVSDHGTILVEKKKTGDGMAWCFTTTKSVRFEGVPDGSVFSLIACVLGYGANAEDYIHSCAVTSNPDA